MKARDCWFHPKETKPLSKYQRWRAVAKTFKLSKSARIRLEWAIFYETKAFKNASLTCRHFGISRKTLHKWHALFDKLSLRSLKNRSRAPINRRRPDYSYAEVARMQELRAKYPTLGREKLVPVYLEDYGISINPQAAKRIVSDCRLYC